MRRRDNNPLDAFLIRKIEKTILAVDDVKTGRANFRFRQIGHVTDPLARIGVQLSRRKVRIVTVPRTTTTFAA